MFDHLQFWFNVVNAAGSIGTVGAFIFLLKKDKAKEKQIRSLSELTNLLAQQNSLSEKRLKLTTSPDLWLNGADYNSINGELKIDLNNKGKTAFLDNIVLLSGNIFLDSISLPYEIEEGGQRFIFGRLNLNRSIDNCIFEIEIQYHDKLNYRFSIIIEGKGVHVKIVSKKEM